MRGESRGCLDLDWSDPCLRVQHGGGDPSAKANVADKYVEMSLLWNNLESISVVGFVLGRVMAPRCKRRELLTVSLAAPILRAMKAI
jgi:hypothetical protein